MPCAFTPPQSRHRIDRRSAPSRQPGGEAGRDPEHHDDDNERGRIVGGRLEQEARDDARRVVCAGQARDQAERHRPYRIRIITPTTWPGRAPNATRTPISRVRRATAYAVMLKIPTSVSSSPKTPSIVSSSIRCRGFVTCWLSTAAAGLTSPDEDARARPTRPSASAGRSTATCLPEVA